MINLGTIKHTAGTRITATTRHQLVVLNTDSTKSDGWSESSPPTYFYDVNSLFFIPWHHHLIPSKERCVRKRNGNSIFRSQLRLQDAESKELSLADEALALNTNRRSTVISIKISLVLSSFQNRRIRSF